MTSPRLFGHLPRLILMAFCLAGFNAQADYYQCLTKPLAEKTLGHLSKHRNIIHYIDTCGQVDVESIHFFQVTKVYIQSDASCHYVMAEGLNASGDFLTLTLDLAYTWIQKGGFAYNLAAELNLPLNHVCYTPFDWNTLEQLEGFDSDSSSVDLVHLTFLRYEMQTKHSCSFGDDKVGADEILVELEDGILIFQYLNEASGFERRFHLSLRSIQDMRFGFYGVDKYINVRGMVWVEDLVDGEPVASTNSDLCMMPVDETIGWDFIRTIEQLMENY